MRRKAPAQRHALVQIRRGRDPEEAVQVRRRGALVGAQQSRRLLVRRAHVQLLDRRHGERVAAAARPARVALVALHCLFIVLSHGRLGARQNRLVVSGAFFCLGLNF